jgi:hypothetical protein
MEAQSKTKAADVKRPQDRTVFVRLHERDKMSLGLM